MKDIQQLIKRDNQEGKYKDIFPQTYIEAISDRQTGVGLDEILNSFNMYFLNYLGDASVTRLQVIDKLRRQGLWITYVTFDNKVIIEWYNSTDLSNTAWANSSNWMQGNNMLVGDITISSNGTWVINGEDTGIPARGEQGITPILRVSEDNRLEVSYNEGNTWNGFRDIPVFIRYRVHNNKLQESVDFGKTWEDVSDYIGAWFRWNKTSEIDGTLQISRDEKKTWEDISPVIATDIITNSEDIVKNDSKELEFANKEYNPEQFSGLGRVYLRKNIVDGKNILTQEMINKPNTRYIIQYDYDLNQEEITIPENCTLDFQGGSFANGTIIGNNTKIKSGLQRIFSTSITIQGSWNILASFPEWFGASGNGVTNDTIPFIKALGFNCSVILSNNYNLNGNTVQITGQNISIIGKGHSDNTGVITNGCLKLVSPSRFITIKSLKIINTNSSVSYGILAEESITKLILDDIYVTGCIIAGISLTDCWDTVIQNSNFTSNNYGLQLKTCYSSSIRKCNAYYNNIGLDVNGDAGSYYDMTVQENKLTGALFNGAWGCVIDLYAEQNGYQGTNAQETSQIYVSANTGQDPSSGNLITGYFIGGIGSDMESTYNVYLNYASNNIIQVTSVRCANGIYCTSNSIRNRISASISVTNTASIVNNGIMNSINNSTAVRQDALTSITSMVGEFSYVIGADRLAYKNNDGNWVGVDGYNVVLKRKGTTEERPTPLLGDSGFQYYDTTLKKYICWNGTTWTNFDGTPLS